MEIKIKILSNQDIEDFSELIDVFEAVFEMEDFVKPTDRYLQDILAKPNFFVLVAKAENEVLGGLTVYVLDQYYSPKPLAYIYDLAIAEAYQRKGIGKALMAYLSEYCKEKGFEEIFVQADRSDDYALDFYRHTKPSNEEDVVHFSYKL